MDTTLKQGSGAEALGDAWGCGAGAGVGQQEELAGARRYQESGSLSLKPLAKGLLAIFSWVICREKVKLGASAELGKGCEAQAQLLCPPWTPALPP